MRAFFWKSFFLHQAKDLVTNYWSMEMINSLKLFSLSFRKHSCEDNVSVWMIDRSVCSNSERGKVGTMIGSRGLIGGSEEGGC